MTEVKFYDGAEDSFLKFAVIIAKTKDRFIFVNIKKETHMSFPAATESRGKRF